LQEMDTFVTLKEKQLLWKREKSVLFFNQVGNWRMVY